MKKNYLIILYEFFFIFLLLTDMNLFLCKPNNLKNPLYKYTKYYAIVVSKNTLNDSEWKKVVYALKEKYERFFNVTILVYENNIWEVRNLLASLLPDYICFVNKFNEVNPEFIKEVNRLTRELDEDPYGDSIWAILTGYTANDALRIINCKKLIVKRMLAGCAVVKWLKYVQEGIVTSEIQYEKEWIKFSNGTIKEIKCPIDRTEFLARLLNSNKFDIFITSGHANHNVWQLHYPLPGSEGYFISKRGRLYGKTYNGKMIEIKTSNPKIYFGLGNCYIGSIINENSMPLAWIHSGGAIFYTGYVISEGPHSYQLGGIPAYFFVQDNYTWSEAFFANNQALIFDMLHKTPGVDPDYLRTDVDGAALYGEPALQVNILPINPPLYDKKIIIKNMSNGRLNITIIIKMNYNGTPGWNGKWSNRHPVILLPFKISNIIINSTNAYKVVATENFVLLYIWKLKDPPLKRGEERYVIMTADLLKRPLKIETKQIPQVHTIYDLLYPFFIVIIIIIIFIIFFYYYRKFRSEKK
ncbi:MAG: hypothetical protein DRJ34_04125 [Thermoprotei archaeon]|nr:MAG: hypothetical protein DRJ34_04125 [Thermoprotei archaeon]